MANITLTSSMRSNLSSLKTIQTQMNRTQERLATGKKVNSAIDNASSYYQARSLTNRAADLNALLDSMGQGIQTIQAAITGLEKGLDFISQASAIAMEATGKLSSIEEVTVTRDKEINFHDFWNGKSNTEKIVNQLKDSDAVYAAEAAAGYYAVSDDDETFGAGNWYLPSLGELMDVYGYNYAETTAWDGTSGAPSDGGDSLRAINGTLDFLSEHHAPAKGLSGWYWTSTENTNTVAWRISMTDGKRSGIPKGTVYQARAFLFIENIIDSSIKISNVGEPVEEIIGPEIGDIVYSDKTWSKADEDAYNEALAAGKTAVGVVTWVSDSGASVKIAALKNTTSTYSWGVYNENIDDLKDYNNASELLGIFHGVADGSISRATGTTEEIVVGSNADFSEATDQFNKILDQYNELIIDSRYQGINLLNNGQLNLIFNEDRTHTYSVVGKDMTAGGMGVNQADWQTVADIKASIEQLQSAVTQMRGFSEVLGNSYSIIQTRENFTDGLTEILETGADELLLADMNEESADYLSLQVRSNLAINALSLASQSAQSVLKLF